MKLVRDVIVARLRDLGRDEYADRAELELPEKVDVARFQDKLKSYGLRVDDSYGMMAGGESRAAGLGGGVGF